MEFAGNLLLFVGLLLCIFFVHVVVASSKEAIMILEKRAVDEVKVAKSQGIPISDLSSRVLGKKPGPGTPPLLDSESIESRRLMFDSNNTTDHDIQNEFNECRDRSSSIWVHFPHLELVFIFFAFQGVVASQAQVIRDTGFRCLPVIYTAITILVRRENISLRLACGRLLPLTLYFFHPSVRNGAYHYLQPSTQYSSTRKSSTCAIAISTACAPMVI